VSARKPAPNRKPASHKAPMYRTIVGDWDRAELELENDTDAIAGAFAEFLWQQEKLGYELVSVVALTPMAKLSAAGGEVFVTSVTLLTVFRRRAR
jgi:hypothetical protein